MNKMNLPPPFGPERKRPEFPKGGEAKSDELKYYGPSVLKEQKGVEEEDDEYDEYESKRFKEESSANPFNKTNPTSNLFNPEKVANPTVTEQPTQPVMKVVSVENADIKTLFVQPTAVRTCISRQEILKHRISKEEMSQQKAFKNYAYGEPSAKLYIRNLAKDTTSDDLLNLFGCFFDSDDKAKEQAIDNSSNTLGVLRSASWRDE